MVACVISHFWCKFSMLDKFHLPASLTELLSACLAARPADLHPDDPSGQTTWQRRRSVHCHERLLKWTLHHWPLIYNLCTVTGGLGGQWHVCFFYKWYFCLLRERQEKQEAQGWCGMLHEDFICLAAVFFQLSIVKILPDYQTFIFGEWHIILYLYLMNLIVLVLWNRNI